jgi:hypothetical protein
MFSRLSLSRNKNVQINWDALKAALNRASKNTVWINSRHFYIHLFKKISFKRGLGTLGEYFNIYKKAFDEYQLPNEVQIYVRGRYRLAYHPDTLVDWKERLINLQDLLLIEPEPETTLDFMEILGRFPPEDSPTRFKTIGEYIDFEDNKHTGSKCIYCHK